MADEENKGTELSLDDAKAFLAEFGLDGFPKASEVLKGYKGDIGRLKADSKAKADLEKELEAYRTKDEERKRTEMTELEKERADKAALLKRIEDQDTAMKRLVRDRSLDNALFDNLRDKPLAATRKKLYLAEAASQEWETPEDLKRIFAEVDKSLEEELGSHNVKIASLPGDTGGGGGGGGASKYDEDYMKQALKARTERK